MIPSFLDKSLVPHKPGVYQFKDRNNRVIYVGKAIDLFSRVSSYFSGPQNIKTLALVNETKSVETIFVESELEALILEANLIKKYLPQFNVRLTDDKDYLYIGITKEDFPKVITLRKQDLKRVKKFFGPFPSSTTVKETLKLLRKVFPWCSGARFKRPCFYYHINQCPGACVGLISPEDYNAPRYKKRRDEIASDYRKVINRFAKFMDGKKEELILELTREMIKASEQKDFEQAGQLKKMVTGINYLTQVNRTKMYLENPNFLEDQRQIALQELQKVLSLPTLPNRIEGYDISNVAGKESTGSMVVLTNGEIDKSQYRKFKIQITGRPNDVGMHKEMIRRRIKNDWLKPDLLLIDGGKGQVSGVVSQIKGTEFENIPVFGLAKRMEWLYGSSGQVIKLSRRSPALMLLQKIRDEAHRFALAYHRKLHGKMILNEGTAQVFPNKFGSIVGHK